MMSTRIALSALMLLLGSTQAQASASDWQDHDFARTRLVTGVDSLTPGTETLWLGWEIELDRGWKTYWRSPGEAGLPVALAVESQDNLASFDVRYPFPERFAFYGIETYGYKDRVILPLAVTPKDDTSDLVMAIKADFQICEEICIPITAIYAVDIPASKRPLASPHAQSIEDFVEKIPDRTGDDGAGLDIDYVSVRGPAGRQRLTIDVEAAEALGAADVIIEADPRFTFETPRFALQPDKTSGRFVYKVGSVDGPLSLQGQAITISFSDGKGNAIERTMTLE